MKNSGEAKRRRIDSPSQQLTGDRISSSDGVKKVIHPKPGPAAPSSGGRVDYKIQQAKNFAVAQAQKDGCTGNFRIFDSPFDNFLLPVVPSRAELGG